MAGINDSIPGVKMPRDTVIVTANRTVVKDFTGTVIREAMKGPKSLARLETTVDDCNSPPKEGFAKMPSLFCRDAKEALEFIRNNPKK